MRCRPRKWTARTHFHVRDHHVPRVRRLKREAHAVLRTQRGVQPTHNEEVDAYTTKRLMGAGHAGQQKHWARTQVLSVYAQHARGCVSVLTMYSRRGPGPFKSGFWTMHLRIASISSAVSASSSQLSSHAWICQATPFQHTHAASTRAKHNRTRAPRHQVGRQRSRGELTDMW